MPCLSRLDRIAIVDRVFAQEMAKPYVEGVSDCFFLGLADIDALRGTEFSSEYAGVYKTLRGSQHALRRRGHTSLTTFFPTLGLESIPAGRCAPGDIGIPVTDGVEHIAIFTGAAFRSRGPDGDLVFRLADIAAACRS
jgi:hypothetical protein